MRILFCCEFYAPSVGGVQEVIRQIAERLAQKGHHVTVATSKLSERDFSVLNNVHIREFAVSGNLIRGIFGEEDQYRDYVIRGDFDVVMIKAAQQWTFDALWPVLDQLSAPKVFIPCGFSGLMEPAFADYFSRIPEILKKFDHLIFYASDYRDINFVKQHGIDNLSIIPNGASEREFNVAADRAFRSRNVIPEDAFVFLTVGSFTGLKGHHELILAFEKLMLPDGRDAVLILNGNDCVSSGATLSSLMGKMAGLLRSYGLIYTTRHILKTILRGVGIWGAKSQSFKGIASAIHKKSKNKKVIIANYPRQELIQAYMAADLFVFASNVEYSPLVLFESAAAGTPFLSVDVGNAIEISDWTQAGKICKSEKDSRGYTRVNPEILAEKMAEMMQDKTSLGFMGERGKRNWAEHFTWDSISNQYEQLFEKIQKPKNND